MERARELVIETAGLYNTVGFNDDTRAVRVLDRPSIRSGGDGNSLLDQLANVVAATVSERLQRSV